MAAQRPWLVPAYPPLNRKEKQCIQNESVEFFDGDTYEFVTTKHAETVQFNIANSDGNAFALIGGWKP